MSEGPSATGGTTVRVLPAGSRGVLLEVADTAAVLRLHAAVAALALPGVVDLVPAARTLLVVLDPAVTTPGAVAEAARRARPNRDSGPETAAGRTVEVPVRYDGEDLAETAAHLGLDPAALVGTHTATTWVVAFCGFAPGFPYCVATDGPAVDWQVPRRAEPRTRVPAGAVALAGPWTGLYPTASPGGWQLLGTTDAPLWDTDRDPPALLPPGTRVRFRDVGT
ncbi:5-oxoprolinase subunit B family protein [Aquipuribacter sp. SD81]|uniref:5-oxoprolinase subunit B family protein n=1 Tax=Aquipuribacter sp. SD81 TaxID=3127703 RepID=UPI003019A495